jgi:hypothetical protein
MVTTPIEAVAAILLKDSRFRRLSKPLRIAGVTIDVADAFVASDRSLDLVLVGDNIGDQAPRRLVSALEGAARALDLVQSRRPLTLVVVGPRPSADNLRELVRYARVLPVGEAPDDDTLRNWLAALLPLELPEVGEARGDIANAELVSADTDPLVEALVRAAQAGKDEVTAVLLEAIEEPFDVSDSEPEELSES